MTTRKGRESFNSDNHSYLTREVYHIPSDKTLFDGEGKRITKISLPLHYLLMKSGASPEDRKLLNEMIRNDPAIAWSEKELTEYPIVGQTVYSIRKEVVGLITMVVIREEDRLVVGVQLTKDGLVLKGEGPVGIRMDLAAEVDDGDNVTGKHLLFYADF